MTQDSVKFCPQCGSASVNFSALAGGTADCTGCNWHGTNEDLLVVPVKHDFVGKESILIDMMNDLRKFMSGELGLPWLKFLLRWGFIQGDINDLLGTVDRKSFARYMAAIARGVLTAVFEERSHQSAAQGQKGKLVDASKH